MTPAYSRYYNETRTHLSSDKDAPLGRSIQRQGAIVAVPILSGLHHCLVPSPPVSSRQLSRASAPMITREGRSVRYLICRPGNRSLTRRPTCLISLPALQAAAYPQALGTRAHPPVR